MKNMLIIGVGDAGCSIAENIAKTVQQKLLAVNTCVKTLDSYAADHKIFLNMAGKARNQKTLSVLFSAEKDKLIKASAGKDIAIICAGLGGFTGTNCTLLMSNILKDKGLTVMVAVTLPMNYESEERKKFAEQALKKIEQVAKTVFVHDHAKKLMTPNHSRMTIADYFSQIPSQFAIDITALKTKKQN